MQAVGSNADPALPGDHASGGIRKIRGHRQGLMRDFGEKGQPSLHLSELRLRWLGCWHAKSPARKIRGRVLITFKSGGPHAGFASGMRKKSWRSARTARVSPDDVRIRQAVPCTPGMLPPPGLLRPRSGQTAGVVLEFPAQTLTRRTGPVMSATAPDRILTFPARHCGARKRLPARWLALHGRISTARQRNPDGLRLLPRPAARYGRSRKAYLPPEPKRSRFIRQRERTKYGMGAEGGDEKGAGFG